MNTFLMITLAIAIPAYALLWHNQPAQRQKEKATPIEAALTFLFDLSWVKRTSTVVANWVVSNLPPKWTGAKLPAHSRTRI